MKILKEPYTVHGITAVDGDTIDAWIQISDNVRIKWRIRLTRVEGGELHEAIGQEALKRMNYILDTTEQEGASFFGNVSEHDKYGRHVGDIRFKDQRTLTGHLMSTGLYWRRDRKGRHFTNVRT